MKWSRRNLVSTSLISLLVMSCTVEPEIGESTLNDLEISIVSGDSQFAATSTTFTSPVIIQVTGPDIENVPILFETADGSAEATLSQSSVYTDADGQAQTTVTSTESSGTISLNASIQRVNVEKSVTFNLFVNGAAVDWKITNSGGANETAGTPFTLTIEATLEDGSTDTDFNGDKQLSFSTTAGDSPNGTSPSLPADGLYNFTNGVITNPPSVTLFDSSESGADTFTISVSGSNLNADATDAIQVADGATASAKILDANACTATEVDDESYTIPTSQFLYAFYFDAYDNCIDATTANGTWTKTFSDPQATFTGGTVGVQSVQLDPILSGSIGTVTFNDGTYSDTTGNLTLTDGNADHFIITGLDTEGNFTASAGTAVTVLVEARDVSNNTATTYNGAKTLTWTSTATTLTPPAALALGNQNAATPTDGSYTFVNGILTSPAPSLTLYNAAETPTITVHDGASCGTAICATSSALTVNTLASAHALIRDQAGGAGGDGATFDAATESPTADSSYTLYCATYDSLGNYLTDDTGADWIVNGVILAGDISPDLTDESSITYSASDVGTGSIDCDTDGTVDGAGIADNSGTFTVVPGAPSYFAIDGGSGDGAAFTETAGTAFSLDINLYDADDNPCTNFTNASYATTVSYIGSTAVFPSYPAELSPTNTSPRINNTATTSTTVNLNISGGTATITNNMLINDTEDSDEPRISIVDNSVAISSAISGLITVNQDSLAHLSIRDTANNGGSYVNSPSIDNDTNLTLYAAGYDDSGNFIGDQSVDWTDTAPAGNCNAGDLSGNPAPITGTDSVIFNPDTSGSCVITATSGAITDTTGTITMSNGAVASFDVEQLGGSTAVTAGTTFSVSITALDADGNRVFDYSPDTTYSFGSDNGASPEGQNETGFTLTTGDWTSGQAVISGVAVYNATTFDIDVTETGAGSITGTSPTLTASPNTLHHYSVTGSTGPFVADNASAFSVTVEARDEWGNATTTGIGNLIDITAVQQADEATVGVIANSTGLDLAGASSQTFGTMTYTVSHQVELIATDTGAVTTPTGLGQTVTFTPDAAGIVSYDLTNFSTATPSAGDAFTADLRAIDAAGNVITGLDATLDTYNFTITSGANQTECSAAPEDYCVSPTHPSGLFTFTNGVTNQSFTFYAAEAVANISFSVDDGVIGPIASASDTSLTVSADPLNHYSATSSTVFPIDADGATTFNTTIHARDTHGNIVAGDASIDLGVNQITGGAAGTLGGSTTTIVMTSGTSTISDLTYDVAGDMELTATGAASVTLPSNRSEDMDFDAAAGSVDHYELTLGGNATAGTPYNITVTAKDSGDNTITDAGVSTTLSGLTFTWTGLNNSPEGDTPTLDTDLSFTAGVATATLTFVNAETIAIGNLSVNDGSINGTTTGALTVDPDTAHHVVFVGATSGTADNTTTYSLDIESRDDYGNTVATGNGADSNLTLDINRISGVSTTGPIGGTITGINLRDNATVTIADITYQVAHTTQWDFTTPPSHSNGIDNTLSPTVTWGMTTGTVATYTIEPDSGTATAGTAANVTLTAQDGGGNTIVGEDATLDTINFTFSTCATLSCDAPDGNGSAAANDPADGTLTFSSGTVSLSYTFFNATNGVAAGELDITDTTNTINATNVGTVTVSPDSSDHFKVVAAGFSANADGTNQTGTSAAVTLYDQYGNARTDGAITNATIGFTKISGYGSSNGTLGACSPAAGDGCAGAAADVSTFGLDFSAADTQTLNDLSYDVGNVIELNVTDAGAPSGTPTGTSDDMTFVTTTATVASYTLTLDDPTAVAGATTDATFTALDAAGNTIDSDDAILDTINYTFTTAASTDAPDSSEDSSNYDPADGTLTFSSGVATLTYTFFHAVNDVAVSDLTVNDTTNTIGTNNSDTLDVTPAASDHFLIEASGFPIDADGANVGTTSVDITLEDDYGNDKTDAGVTNATLSLVQVSGYTNTGTMTACTPAAGDACGTEVDITGMSLDFSAASTLTLNDIGYNVAHTMEIQAAHAGVANNTPTGYTDDLSFNFVAGTVASYTLTLDDASAVAGATTDASLTALDAASNVLSSDDATLDTITFNFTTAAATDAPDASEDSSNYDPADGSTLTFTSGVAPVTYTFFHATNDVQVNDLQIDDTTNTLSVNNSDTIDITPAASDHFLVEGSGFPVAANGTNFGATSIDVTLEDDYGNDKTDATVTNATVSLVQLSGYTNTGTMTACTPAAGDGCGTEVDVTGMALDFSAASTVTLNDVGYDVAHVMEVQVAHGNVANNTPTGYTDDITWNISTGTVASYTLTLDDASAVAGASTDASLTAFDGGGNVIDSDDATLDTITYNFTVSADQDAPDGSQDASDDDPADGSTLTFTSGVAPVTYTFYHAVNDVAVSDLQIDDTTNTISVNNSDTIDITVAATDRFTIGSENGFPANADATAQTSTDITVTLVDLYGNPKTDGAVTAAAIGFNRISGATNTGTMLACSPGSGDGCGGGAADITTITLDFSGATSRTLYDFAYDVGHVVELDVTDAGVPNDTLTADSSDLTFNATANTVASYTLTLDDASAVAGASTDATLTAFDAASNVITTNDTALDTITYNFTTAASTDAPDSSEDSSDYDPADGSTLSFSSGVATVSYTFFHATNDVAVSDLQIDDTTNTLSVNNSDTLDVTVAASDHFLIAAAGFPINADGANNAGTSLTITLEDDYGNDRTDGAVTNATLSLNRISGYTNTGTMTACTPAAGDGCGTEVDITGMSLDFSSAATLTLNDIGYNVAHVVEVQAAHAGVANNTPTGYTDDLTFNFVAGNVASYTLTLDDASAVAGATTDASLTALDAASNIITGNDATLDTITYNFTTAASTDAPDASEDSSNYDPADGSTLSFTSGVAAVTYTFFHATNDVAVSDLQIDDTTNTISVNNSDTIDITPAASDHFLVEASGFPQDADAANKAGTSIDITLEDDYGNDKTDGAVTAATASLVRISGYTNTGTMTACTPAAGDGCGTEVDVTGMALDFSSASTITLHDVSYDVAHVMELQVADAGVANNTPTGYTDDITWNISTGTVASYTLTLDDASVVAGVSTDASLTAYDGGSNVIDSDDATLDTITYNFTVSADQDAPDGSQDASDDDPADGSTLTFSSGVATVSYTFYHAVNDVAVSDLQIDDTTNTISVNNSDTIDVTPAATDRFTVGSENGFPANADGTAQTSTDITVTLVDLYGNPKTDGAVTAATLSFNRISGATNTGTLEACSPGAGDGCGGGDADITTITLDFSGASSRTLYDFTYNVGHVIEIIASDAGVPNNTLTADSSDLTFNATAGTVASYTLTLDDASAVAGASTDATLTALDGASNVITTNDTALDTITFNFTVSADQDAPDGSQDASDDDPADGSTLTFSSGVATVSYQFYHAVNDVAVSDLQIDDTTNTISVNNSDTLDVTVAATDRFTIGSENGFPANADGTAQTSTDITVTLVDLYGNPKTDGAVTAAALSFNRISGATNTGTLEACSPGAGDGCGGGKADITTITLDFSGATNRTLYDFTYDVGHVIEIIASDAGVPNNTLTADSSDLTFNATAGTVASYTLTLDDATETAGTATNATLTALDAASNVITTNDTALDTITFNFTVSADQDAPDGSEDASDDDPADGSTLSFSSGVASVSYTFYHATNDVAVSDLQIDDTTNTISVNNSDTLDVQPASSDHFEITATGFPVNADGANNAGTSLAITLEDDYGNATTDGAVTNATLSLNRISGFTNTGTMTACTPAAGDACGTEVDVTGMSLDFSASSTLTLHDVGYNVAHVVEVQAAHGSVPNNTPTGLTDDITFNFVAGNVASYTLTLDDASAVAGASTDASLTAYDAASNVITGQDATLDTITYNFTVSADQDAPDGSEDASDDDPADGSTLTFSSGVAAVSYQFYHATNDVAVSDLQIDDTTNTISVNNSDTIDITPAATDRFTVDSENGFPANADGTAQTSTDITVTLVDLYGNPKTDGAVTAATLSFNRISGATNTGTLEACSPGAGDGCGGGKADLTTITLDFSGASSRTLYDFTYDVGHVIEILAADAGVPNNTLTADSNDLTFNATAGTVASYTLTLDDASAVAGASTNASLTALDAASNVITTNDTALDAITFNFTVSADQDAPDGSQDASDDDPADGSTLTFSSGVATVAYTFYHATNDVAVSDLQIDDTTNTISVNNSDTLDVTVAATDRFTIGSENGFPATADGTAQTSTDITVTLVDLYGNPKTDGAVTAAAVGFNRISGATNTGTMLACSPGSGDGCGGGAANVTTITLNFSASTTQTLYDFTYDVGHVIEFDVTDAGVPNDTLTADSSDLTFNATAATVASYTLTLDDATETAGTATNATLTALDAASNVITTNDTALDAITFNFITPASTDAPDGSEDASDDDPADGSTLSFSSGVASVSYTFYHATNDVGVSDLQIDDTTNTISVNNSDTLDVQPASSDHFEITAAGFPVNADGANNAGTSLAITLEDDYGNATTDGAVTNATLSLNRISGFTNTGTMTACTPAAGDACGTEVDVTGMSLDFSASSTLTLHDVGYDVAHVVEVQAAHGSVPNNTPTGLTDDITFNFVAGNVASYTLTLDDATETAGTSTNASLTAYDAASNIITGQDATLDTITYNFTVSADQDAPDGSEDASDDDPADGSTLTFSSGVASVAYTFYHATNDVAVSDLQIDDTTNTISVNNSDTLDVQPASSDHFSVAATGFPVNADGSNNAGTSLAITLEDDYGNATTDGAVTNATLSLNRISGFTNLGTMTACTPAAGDACGTEVDITGMSLDFSGAATQTLNDIGYDVAHVVEVQAAHASVPNNTPTGNTDDITFNFVAGNVASYTLTLDDASAVAGASTNASLTALDAASNVITGNDATLDTITYNFTVSADQDAPDGSEDASDDDPTDGSTLTFSSGVATVAYTFYHATNDVAVSDLQIDDTTNTISVNNSDTLDVTVAATDRFTIGSESGFPATADGTAQTSTDITVTLVDLYGNAKTDGAVTAAAIGFNRISGATNTGTMLACSPGSGDGCGGGAADITTITLDFSGASSRTLYDFAYDVGHVVELDVTDAGVPNDTLTADSSDLTFNATAGTVASYTLTLDDATETAGTATNATLTALDAASNVITTNDTALDTITFNFTTAASTDAPDTSEDSSDYDPADGSTLSFSSGVASVSYTFFNATNDVAVSDLQIDDTTNTLSVNNSDTQTINAAASDHFLIAATGFPVNADGANNAGTSIAITLEDDYGNDKTDGAVTNATLALNRISGFTNTGTMTACTPAAGDGCGTEVDVTGMSLDFSASSTLTLHDIGYDVAHVVELQASHAGVANNTPTSYTDDITFNFSVGNVASYTLTLDDATETAGTSTNASLTALDGGGNTITGQDATLDTITYNFTTSANLDAPDASEVAANYDPANGSTLTFSSGVAPVTYTFFNAANNVSVSDLQIDDTTNTISVNNSDTQTINSAAAQDITINAGNGQTATVDTDVATDPQVKVIDDYGNPVSGVTVNFAITDALPASGSLGTTSGSTDASGLISTTYTLGQTAGTNTMRATGVGLTGTTFVDFTETGDPDSANKLVYTTEPVANETVGIAFDTQPVVEIRDQFDNLVDDDVTVVTLTPHEGAGCTNAPAGVASNNTATASNGVATFASLSYNAAEDVSFEAGSGALTVDCATATTVYATMSIDTVIGTVNTGDVTRIEVTGGVPPLTFSLSANNSLGSIGGSYTGGACTAGKICADYTAGKNGGGSADTVQVDDSAATPNTDTEGATINGAAFTNTGDTEDFGSGLVADTSQTYTIDNGGNASSGAITVTFTPDNGTYWSLDSDLCNTVDLATSGTCDIDITFIGSTAPSGPYTATLVVEGANGGIITLNLTADRL